MTAYKYNFCIYNNLTGIKNTLIETSPKKDISVYIKF